jgi:hypothetical protein
MDETSTLRTKEDQSSADQIERCFTFHAPTPAKVEDYENLREHAKGLAYKFAALCPQGRERALAQTKLEEAVFWANAAIARG